jgi:uncharacterized protein (TIGR02328 family)
LRLWHYSLLPYLPRQQLLSQWRECCCIAKSITEKGTLNHILVNKIMDYPIDHFIVSTITIHDELPITTYLRDAINEAKRKGVASDGLREMPKQQTS